jgi:hypothetical protein
MAIMSLWTALNNQYYTNQSKLTLSQFTLCRRNVLIAGRWLAESVHMYASYIQLKLSIVPLKCSISCNGDDEVKAVLIFLNKTM